ncbi:zinc finger protein 830 [Ictalurus punctatus]|uniref:Zinc finger protein 830 n=1 Tax=Ictalurus punctatus TaxID=7998 RepID=W5UCV8_ICTPU|nr:zinc finger protein 830 [Ictalurus punctatus]
MASKAAKGKKVVNQEELRRLMRQKKQQAERQKRVESPYAKYNSLGHLSCVLCNVQVKTEILWQAHVLGKQHKDKVSELKQEQSVGKVPEAPQTSTLKRKAAKPEVYDGKKPKASGADFLQGKTATSGPSAGFGLLAGYDDDDDDDDKSGQVPSDIKQPGPASDELPADFFDSSVPGVASTPAPAVSHLQSISIAKAAEPVKKIAKMAEAIPEGFFDDPVRDAKVRNVETPKDHMDKEWEEFQKEIRQVSSQSEAIVAEEDEKGRCERQIDEIDEQIECLRRVEVLRARQEAVKNKVKNKMLEDVSESSGEEEEDEEELMNVLGRDWRAKGALA